MTDRSAIQIIVNNEILATINETSAKILDSGKSSSNGRRKDHMTKF